MPATLATIDPILKEVYRGKIREQLNDETIALSRIARSSNVTTEIGGKYVTFPVHTRRNSGIGSRLESEALPTPGNQGFAAARVGLKYAYAGVQLTGQAIALSESNEQAFASILDNEMSRLKVDIKKDMNRQIYGDGTGAIGTVSSAGTTSTTVTVADARYFQVGEVIDIITLPSTVAVTGRVVNAVNLTSNTLTLDSAVTTSVGQILVRKGSGPSASGNREITGLSAIVNNSNALYNINPASEPEWTSEVNSNGGTGRAVNEALFIQMIDRIRVRGGETSLILTSLGVRRAYFALLSQLRQTVNTTSFTGGFKGLAFTTDMGEVPMVADPDAPIGKAFFLNESNFTYYRPEEWDWFDRQGSIWQQVRDANGDYDAWYARLYEYHELGCDRRNSQGLISDLSEG